MNRNLKTGNSNLVWTLFLTTCFSFMILSLSDDSFAESPKEILPQSEVKVDVPASSSKERTPASNTCKRLESANITDGSFKAIHKALEAVFPEWNSIPSISEEYNNDDNWPEGFATCKVKAHNTITVSRASCADFEKLLTQTNQWSSIYDNVHDI